MHYTHSVLSRDHWEHDVTVLTKSITDIRDLRTGLAGLKTHDPLSKEEEEEGKSSSETDESGRKRKRKQKRKEKNSRKKASDVEDTSGKDTERSKEKTPGQMDFLSYLPPKILDKIAAHLSPKELSNLSCVSSGLYTVAHAKAYRRLQAKARGNCRECNFLGPPGICHALHYELINEEENHRLCEAYRRIQAKCTEKD
jgi:hypothetical protein